ncbi:MAG: hypothetical protein EOO15_08460 [Chitinophagaceae bacterium]|nr:MAG: hypothetical protein EOO15_08460 [Chitinophagaceae bacterium]
MRRIMILVEILFAFQLRAQEPDQLERSQERSERLLEEEPLQQDLAWRRLHPLNLNTATADALRLLPGVSELQVQSLLLWRMRMGALLVVEELAAVPYWNAETVRRLQAYLTTEPGVVADSRSLLKEGTHNLLFRGATILTRTEPYREGQYAGGPERLSLRYRYRKDDRLRIGVNLEKDPGEALSRGPDFTSVHMYWQGKGLLQTLALGDFTVNMGQGLIQWDAPAYGGAADLAALKRQGPFLQAPTSSDEYRFARGAGVTLQKGAWQLSAYISLRRLDGRLQNDSTSEHISSINRGGYHRTAGELAAHHAFTARAAGGRLQWERGALRLAVNGRFLQFSQPLVAGKQPYELFEAAGERLRHLSLDWGFTLGPAHFFGEAAMDKAAHFALTQGLLFSGGARWDAALLYRRLPAYYAAFDGNAVTRRSEPQNEEGFYLAFQLRPAKAWQLEAWGDMYRFPWLRYTVDAPGGGFEGGLQAGWHPRKRLELRVRYRYGEEESTEKGAVLPRRLRVRRRGLRLQVAQDWGNGWRGSFRSEGLWQEAGGRSSGFATAFGLHFPAIRKWRASAQAYFFNTDSYDTRLYMYSDGAGGGTVAPLYGEGVKYSIIIQYEFSKRVHVSVQGFRSGLRAKNGAPPDTDSIIPELRMQISCHW